MTGHLCCPEPSQIMTLMTNTTAGIHDAIGAARLDGVDLQALADRLSTPLHVYSAEMIVRRIHGLQEALQGLDAMICYAVKANSNIAILRLMHAMGVGADIVSAGELHRCLRAGIPGDRIVFSGVGKTAAEIDEALDAGIARFNVESHDELHLLEQLARARGVVAYAAARINPDVDAGSHAKISTGRAGNKFGVSIAEARGWFGEMAGSKHLRLDGLHVHIGSQILSPMPFRDALRCVAEFWRELVRTGHSVASIDVGGGLGVRYRDSDTPLPAVAYVAEIRQALAGFEGRIVLEPGRYLVAEAGTLLTRVIRVKQGEHRSFLVIDAAMNDLLRPSLYDAWHEIVPVVCDPGRPLATYDIVGPVCETGDTFALARELPECKAGDLLAVRATGAYGASMASTYNSRPIAAEVLVDDGRYAIVQRRQTFEEMLMGEPLAQEWHTT